MKVRTQPSRRALSASAIQSRSDDAIAPTAPTVPNQVSFEGACPRCRARIRATKSDAGARPTTNCTIVGGALGMLSGTSSHRLAKPKVPVDGVSGRWTARIRFGGQGNGNRTLNKTGGHCCSLLIYFCDARLLFG